MESSTVRSGLKEDGGRPGSHTNFSANTNLLVYFLGTCLQASQYLPWFVQHAMEISQLHNMRYWVTDNTVSVQGYLYLVIPDFLFPALSTVANAIFIGGEHVVEFC